MRILFVITLAATLLYALTGIVYPEGDFSGTLVVKPHPMHPVEFGGGEEGTWARHHPGQPLPWFMQNDLTRIYRFSWEEGIPAWLTAYRLGYLAAHLAWVALAVIGAVRLVKALARRHGSDESFEQFP
jgi:hypothetical protein